MANIIMKVQPTIELHIHEIGGDLIVEGLEIEELFASGDDPNVTVTDDGARAHITCDGDCTVRVPTAAIVQVHSVDGDARITNIIADTEVHDVSGDLSIRDCGQLEVHDVSGDFEVKRLRGSLTVHEVSGDADISKVDGDIHIEDVSGDLAISKAVRNVKVGTVSGDMIISATFAPGVSHHVDEVSGDVVIKVAADSSVRFDVPHEVERMVQMRGVRVITDENEERDTITLADGDATVTIVEIGGDLVISRQGSGDQFDRILEDMIPVDLDKVIAEQLSRAQQQIEANRERIEREIERQTSRASKRGFNFGFQFDAPRPPTPPRAPNAPFPPTPPRPPTVNVPINGNVKANASVGEAVKRKDQPVSDDERMLILKMVESGRISIEEAERLFAALEGRANSDQQTV